MSRLYFILNYKKYSISIIRNMIVVILIFAPQFTLINAQKLWKSTCPGFDTVALLSDNFIWDYNIKTLILFNPELQLINTKSIIKSKLKELLSDSKKFKLQSILFLESKKNDLKIFHSSAKLNSTDSDIDEPFKSMHQKSIMTKIKNSASEDWVVEATVKHNVNIFDC